MSLVGHAGAVFVVLVVRLAVAVMLISLARVRRSCEDHREVDHAVEVGVELVRRALRQVQMASPARVEDVHCDQTLVDGAPDGVELLSATSGGAARLLGCPRLLDMRGRRVAGMRETATELLAYLVVHRDGVASESIARDVYAGVPAERAAERFATDLANLRGRLREAAGVGRDVNAVPRARGRYRLVTDLVGVDWWEVLDDWQVVRSAADVREAEPALRRICDAFTDGVLADGAGYDWLSDVQEHSRRLGVAAHVRLADLVCLEDPGAAARLLDRACELDPFDETLARRAMTVLLAVGNSDAAAARLARLREALAEIDEGPEAATLELVAHLC